ncbi:hypothetical protein acsn021_05350 [Anaerocolumna cellulosilytica]|uniref:Phosphopantetheine adenylyltransferase n=1 Tax=Anaerocolumna cellulosilytica TaxID=433286 RepID=A0A6S6QTG7_9FIRM|nr:adenylyltransferase/cytidyltransferase family protein [Anaerocolumna cellulosilytica]MBB5195698.1 [citrate (pro-3S)-lyase] ligase [Anaerocolumna cellulosilytica]BCJ92966.1 hypothetical protein acsn021_05350 [Anaerocolumna cellulosilytica]
MICFCEKEVYVIYNEELEVSNLFSFFCSPGHSTDIVIVKDYRENFVGIITYERLLYKRDQLVQTQILSTGVNIWEEAYKIFNSDKYILYIPVFDEMNELVYFCYQRVMTQEVEVDRIMDQLYKNDAALFLSELYPKIKAVYLYGLNELSYKFYKLLYKRNITVVIQEDIWEIILGIKTKDVKIPSFMCMKIYSDGTELIVEEKDQTQKDRFSFKNRWEFLLDIAFINRIIVENSIKNSFNRMSIKCYICRIPLFEELNNYDLEEVFRHMKYISLSNPLLNIDDKETMKQITKVCGMSHEEHLKKYNNEITERRSIKDSHITKYGREESTIYIVGPCIASSNGNHNLQKDTLLYLLYEFLKKQGLKYSVKGISLGQESFQNVENIVNTLSIKDKDIIIFISCNRKKLCEKFGIKDSVDLFLLDLFNSRNEGEIWFSDNPIHTTRKGNEAIVNELYNKIIDQEIKKMDFSKASVCLQQGKVLLTEYERENLNLYLHDIAALKFSDSIGDEVGTIVMNCNPITYGHLHLIEYASKAVDYLYIFIVEEDRSFFTFEERYKLVKEATAHIPNLRVIPSGQFILSNKTLPAYFTKEYKKEIIIDASEDIGIFAQYIAPVLNISVRFVGQEPLDFITNQYNMEMKRIITDYGIKFVEIPRKEQSGEVISASRVRKLLKENNFDEIKKIVPPTTYNFLKNEFDTDRCL